VQEWGTVVVNEDAALPVLRVAVSESLGERVAGNLQLRDLQGEVGKCLKAARTRVPGQTASVSLRRLWESAVPGVTERAQVAGGAGLRSATEHKHVLSLCWKMQASTLSNTSSRRRERQPEPAAKTV